MSRQVFTTMWRELLRLNAHRIVTDIGDERQDTRRTSSGSGDPHHSEEGANQEGGPPQWRAISGCGRHEPRLSARHPPRWKASGGKARNGEEHPGMTPRAETEDDKEEERGK